MARVISLLAVIAAMLVLVSLTEVQRPSQSTSRKGRGHDLAKQRNYQKDRANKSQSSRHKHKDQRGRRLRDRPMSPLENYLISFHDMNPPAFFNFRWNMPSAKNAPWWQGPNVCENKTEETFNNTSIEMMRLFSTNSQVCDESTTVYKCKIVKQSTGGRRELTVVYKCCDGYTRQKSHVGCPEKVSMVSLMEKAKELGLTDFVRAVKTLKLTKEFQKGNFTIFVPVNGAFTLNSELLDSDFNGIILKDTPDVISVSEPAVGKTLKTLRNAILSHVIPGTVRTSSMQDEQALETGLNGDTSIRINYFSRPEKLMTANCVPVVSRDHMATNGVIHSVGKALRPVTETLLDIVRSRLELSTLKTVLATANYVSTLDQSGQLTLLAPTNLAFDQMSKRLKEKLLNGDRECLEKVLQNHLLPNVICSVAIQGQARTVNQLHRYLNVTRTVDNKLLVNGAQVILSDIMGTNGVMHVIDNVLVPDDALNVLDLIKKGGYSEYLRLIEKAGLTKTLEAATNVTVFVPTNEAIQNLPDAVKTKLKEDPGMLRDVVKFHMSPEILACQRIHDNQLVPTLAGPNLRFNSYSVLPYHHHGMKTAQCAPVAEMHFKACNGIINVIKAVMMPPKGNVLDVLAFDNKFSILVSLVKKSGLADDLQGDGPFTIMAPKNEAFEKIGAVTLAALQKDGERLKKLIKAHIIKGTLCCAGVFRRHWLDRSQVHTMSGDQLRLSRDHDNRPKIGTAQVITCDQTATNGNVLEINRVLVNEAPRERWRFNPFSHWDMPKL